MYIFKSEALIGGALAMAVVLALTGYATRYVDRNLVALEERLDSVAAAGVTHGVARAIYVDCRESAMLALALSPMLGGNSEKLCAEETMRYLGEEHRDVVWKLFLADIGRYPGEGKDALDVSDSANDYAMGIFPATTAELR